MRKTIIFDGIAKKDIKRTLAENSFLLVENIDNWLRIWKTNSLFNLISHQPDIDKLYLYTKDGNEAKHQLLINKIEKNKLTAF